MGAVTDLSRIFPNSKRIHKLLVIQEIAVDEMEMQTCLFLSFYASKGK